MKKISVLSSIILYLLTISISTFAQTDLTGATVTLSSTEYEYDGTAKEPTVYGIRKGTKRYNSLKAGIDYDITYEDNVHAGIATATLIFKGDYSGVATRDFNISPKDLSKEVTLELVTSEYNYDGTAKEPAASDLYYGEIKLVSGVDYDMTYSNNINPGKATAKVTFKGDFGGSAIASFFINEVIAINESIFPDEYFRNWILSQEYGKDNVLTTREISNITFINISKLGIQNLQGIEYFTALQSLLCANNQLTSLEVSQNTALKELDCDYNHLTSINVSQNRYLTNLSCNGNQLTSIDVSHNTRLTDLSCAGNQLTSLDFSQYMSLTRLYCHHNQIKGEGMDTLIAHLPITNRGYMYVIYSNNESNVMTTAQVEAARTKGWYAQYYDGNEWRTYKGSDPTATDVVVNETNFPDENFRSWITCQSFGSDEVLSTTEISLITSINVSERNIHSLKGIEYFTSLQSLSCANNQLTSIDVSQNTALKGLDCSFNQLTSLDVSNNTALTELDCYMNQIKGEGMDALIESFSSSYGTMRIIYNKNEGNDMTFNQANAANRKGWTNLYYDGSEWHTYKPRVPDVLRGDVNGDNKIDMSDVMFMVDRILRDPYYSWSPTYSMTDIMSIINYIQNGIYPDGGYFYLGTTKPTAENYTSLPGVQTTYTSMTDAAGATSSVDANATLYMLCPASWTKDKVITLEDENGNTVRFADNIDNIIISGNTYAVYKTKSIDVSCNLKLSVDAVTDYCIAALVATDPNVRIYSEALKRTGLNATMSLIEDLNYRQQYNRYRRNNLWAMEYIVTGGRMREEVFYPERRMYGFTAFMVKDETLEKYNSTLASHHFSANGSIEENILALAELASKYYTTSVPYTSTDYANPEHPLYKFMAYHILDRNVQGYNFLTVREDAGIDRDIVNPTDWYTTCLPHSMIKVEHLTVGGEAEGAWLGTGVRRDYYINRNYNKNNKVEGIHVQPSVDVQDNNAVNGLYFYIDDILTFDDKTKEDVFDTRIRMDFSTIFPEIMTNNIRMNGTSIRGDNRGRNYFFPQGYLSGLTLNNTDTRLIYWYPRSGYWSMNGDEMDAMDMFDITFDLPPVPFTGNWEIRLGFAPMNSTTDGANYRGQAQIYFDDVKQGAPVDFSKTLSDVYGISASDWNYNKSNYDEWRKDEKKRLEDFNILKSQGYYRGPHSVFNSSNGLISGKYNTFSQMRNTARVVLCTVHIDAGKTHTLRIKNVSSDEMAKIKEAMLDYLEMVPESIYSITEGDGVEDDL